MVGRGEVDRRMWTGVATIVATVCAMALADAVVKQASGEMTLWQIYVTRSLLVIPVLFALGGRVLFVDALGWVVLRSLALGAMYVGIYAAIPVLDLAVIAASLYTGPLFIVALSAIFLREPIQPLNWLAILVGFVGVLLIVRPAAAGFSPYALIPVSAGLLYAVAAVITKAKCARTPVLALAQWLNATLLALGAGASLFLSAADLFDDFDYPFLFGSWSATDWPTIALLAVLMAGISIGLARAYQAPRPHVIATFDYAYLLFAALWGFVFFAETPGPLDLAGMALISVAGATTCLAQSRSAAARAGSGADRADGGNAAAR